MGSRGGAMTIVSRASPSYAERENGLEYSRLSLSFCVGGAGARDYYDDCSEIHANITS